MVKTVLDTSKVYRPSMIVAKLAEKVHGNPIAETIRIDGTVVIVFEDGRKLTFDKDAITRTLTETAEATPESAMPAGAQQDAPTLEDAVTKAENNAAPSARKPRKHKE